MGPASIILNDSLSPLIARNGTVSFLKLLPKKFGLAPSQVLVLALRVHRQHLVRVLDDDLTS
jgi:hypothetical protein